MKRNFKSGARRLLACMFCSVMAVSLWAVPAYRGWQTKTLPNGSTVELRQVGDEFFHYWEDKNGVQYVNDDVKGWQKAEKNAVQSEVSKAMRASRKYNQQDMSQPMRKVGKLNMAPRGLVILVNFSDVAFDSNNTRQAMWDMMNSENYTYSGATGSTREYYRAQSNGQYVPDFDVVGPYTLSHNRAYYGANDESDNDVLPGNMVVEACKLADADGVDFTKYNNDGNSYVDFVYIIYAGAGEADSDVEDAIWPHNWSLAGCRYYHYCTYSQAESKVDGLYINDYACSGELMYGQAGTRCGIGTVAHEFGHVLGLPDYYVTSEDATNYKKKYTPGSWSIMDYGSYNNDGNTPPNYSVFDKYFFGWDTPELLAKDAKVNVELTTGYSDSYQITGGTTALDCRTEQRIWYIENRQKTGWDTYLPGHGMLVWEVTYNASDWNENVPNNEHVGYTIVTANNTTRPYSPYYQDATPTTTSGTTFPGNSKVTSYTPATGCAMTEITESDGKITFKYNGGVVKTECTYELVGSNCVVTADGVVAINAALSLTITPNAGYTLDDASCWMVSMGKDDLVYGKGYTYNAATNEFRIEKVTDDVVILAEGKKTFALTWKSNGQEWTTTTSAGTVVLPATDPESCEKGKVFVGWCEQENYSSATTAPTFVKTGDAVTGAKTFYAVFATQGEGGETAFDGKTGGTFKIYGKVGETKYYATGTVDNSKLQSTTNEANAAAYTFEKVEDGFTIKTGGKYLKHGSGTNVSLQNTAYTWTIEKGTKGSWRINSATSGRALVFRASTYNVFGGYATSNINGTEYFDLEIGGEGGAAYANYTTTLNCTPTCMEQTAVEPTAKKAIRDGQMVIIRGKEIYSVTGVRIQ